MQLKDKFIRPESFKAFGLRLLTHNCTEISSRYFSVQLLLLKLSIFSNIFGSLDTSTIGQFDVLILFISLKNCNYEELIKKKIEQG